MIVLREAIKEKKGNELLDRLADVWTSFYKNVLPMLLAIFYPIQEQGTTIRSVTLIGFRDMVLLKTKIADALESAATNTTASSGTSNTTTSATTTIAKVSPEIKQMLLVLSSVHEDSNPPSENYLKLEKLVERVVSPYLGTGGLFVNAPKTALLFKRNSIDQQRHGGGGGVSSSGSSSPRERKLSISQVLKEEVTRKFRRSGSLTGNSNNNISGTSTGNSSSNNAQSLSTSETNHNRESSFKRRFKLGVGGGCDHSTSLSASSSLSGTTKTTIGTPQAKTITTDSVVVPSVSELSKTTTDDNDMLAYLEERRQRWKSRDEMLGSESLLE